jgi:hypothetical protein
LPFGGHQFHPRGIRGNHHLTIAADNARLYQKQAAILVYQENAMDFTKVFYFSLSM